jgi:hypothetical protein
VGGWGPGGDGGQGREMAQKCMTYE